jgi:uncharacterized membrane protein
MDDLLIARMIHVLSVVIWIGGVYFVTFVILPGLKHIDDKVSRFEAIENRFTKHAKIVVTLAGLSGFYMVHQLDGWQWFTDVDFWWVYAMSLLWLIFTFVLFIAEPLFLHAWFSRQAALNPDRAITIAIRFHQLMALLSFFVIAAAIFGVHG